MLTPSKISVRAAIRFLMIPILAIVFVLGSVAVPTLGGHGFVNGSVALADEDDNKKKDKKKNGEKDKKKKKSDDDDDDEDDDKKKDREKGDKGGYERAMKQAEEEYQRKIEQADEWYERRKEQIEKKYKGD